MAKWFLATAALSAILATSSLASDWSEKRGSIYKPPGEGPHATGGDTLPDGHIASARKGDISKAWYTAHKPLSSRILDDAIEAGGLNVKLRNGSKIEFSLPKNQVFEDRTPRLMDLDGDGRNEVITLLSSRSGGAAIAVYGAKAGKMALLDRTPFIGLSNRWRNIAGAVLSKTRNGKTTISVKLKDGSIWDIRK